MNILFLSHGIPSDKDPQWGCFELDQAKALEALGHKITLAAIDGRFRKGRAGRGVVYSEFGKIHAYLYYLIPFKMLGLKALRLKARSWMTRRLFGVICKKEGMPDVIYSHYLFTMGGLDLVHRDYPDIPIVGIEHWSHLSGEVLSPSNITRGIVGYGLTDRLLAVSPSLQLQIKKHFGKDSEVVYDTVDNVFLESPIKTNKPVAPFRFVSVGTLNEGKGYDVLIRAFAGMANHESELIIIGDGPEKEGILQLCKDLQVEDRIVLKGRLSHEEIVKNLTEANAYVLASRSETFGVSYIEAMAMGLPAIATRCGGPECFMNDSCGLMVDVDDVAGLTAAMDNMVEHIKDYSSEAIREYVRSRFSGEVIARQLEQIFEEVIQKKKQ